MWQIDSAVQLFICFSQCFGIYCLCVPLCECVCVWLWQGSFQTPQPLMNGSLCVRVCVTVYVWSRETFARLFSHQCKIPPHTHKKNTGPHSHHPHHPTDPRDNTHTYTYTQLTLPDVAFAHNPHSSRAPWFSGACYFTCQTSLLLSWSGSLLTHRRPPVTHLQVAICSASRHATVTKY